MWNKLDDLAASGYAYALGLTDGWAPVQVDAACGVVALMLALITAICVLHYKDGKRAKGPKMSKGQKRMVLELHRRVADQIVEVLEDARYKGKVPSSQIDRIYKNLAKSLNLFDLVPRHIPDRTPRPADLKEAIKARLGNGVYKDKDVIVDGDDGGMGRLISSARPLPM